MLSPETDNCPSWINGWERMTVENISWSISTKKCCRLRRGLNPRPPGLQSDGASNWATEAAIAFWIIWHVLHCWIYQLTAKALIRLRILARSSGHSVFMPQSDVFLIMLMLCMYSFYFSLAPTFFFFLFVCIYCLFVCVCVQLQNRPWPNCADAQGNWDSKVLIRLHGCAGRFVLV